MTKVSSSFVANAVINYPGVSPTFNPQLNHLLEFSLKDLSNCDLGVCRYFFQGIFLLGKRP
jgi:hypothetical protein